MASDGYESRPDTDESQDEGLYDDNMEEEEEDDDEFSDASGDDFEALDPSNKEPMVGISRSGRKVMRPQQFVPGTFQIKFPNETARKVIQKSKARIEAEVLFSHIFCCMCGQGDSEPQNRILLCDTCEGGFHQKCHSPQVSDDIAEDQNQPFQCSFCIELKVEKPGSENSTALNSPRETPGPRRGRGRPRKYPRPEDIDSLPKRKIFDELCELEALRCLACGESRFPHYEEVDEQGEPIEEQTTESLEQSAEIREGQNTETAVFLNIPSDVPVEKPVEPSEQVQEPQNQIVPQEEELEERLPPPKTAFEAVDHVMTKLCDNCHQKYLEEWEYIKSMSSDFLAALLLQTSIRQTSAGFSEFIKKQTEISAPMDVRRLMMYSAKPKPASPSEEVMSQIIQQVVQEKTKIALSPRPARLQRPKYTDEKLSNDEGVDGEDEDEFKPEELDYLSAPRRRRSTLMYGSYEDMIVKAILALSEPKGSKPKTIFSWMAANFPGIPDNFRGSATQALKKGVDRGRFIKIENGWYRLNPEEDKESRSLMSTPQMSSTSMSTADTMPRGVPPSFIGGGAFSQLQMHSQLLTPGADQLEKSASGQHAMSMLPPAPDLHSRHQMTGMPLPQFRMDNRFPMTHHAAFPPSQYNFMYGNGFIPMGPLPTGGMPGNPMMMPSVAANEPSKDDEAMFG